MTGLRRYRPLLAVGLLLAAAAVAAMLSTPQVTRVPFRPPGVPPVATAVPTDAAAPPQLPEEKPTLSERHVQMPGWLTVFAQLLCLVLVLVAVGLLIWYLLRNGLRTRSRTLEDVEPPPVPQTREEVLAAVEAGLSDLDDSDTDPRRAVIACWVRLEQAAAGAGTPRHPGDTPTELVGRLLAGHQVSAAVLYPLAEVYRVARYATHTVDVTMRDQARAALHQLRTELSHERVIS
jgi:uncharacterized protein DUF4129